MTNQYITNNNITNSIVNINIYNNTEKSKENVSILNKESIRLLNNSPPSVKSDKITPVKGLMIIMKLILFVLRFVLKIKMECMS